jgi:hypothetical protein
MLAVRLLAPFLNPFNARGFAWRRGARTHVAAALQPVSAAMCATAAADALLQMRARGKTRCRRASVQVLRASCAERGGVVSQSR